MYVLQTAERAAVDKDTATSLLYGMYKDLGILISGNYFIYHSQKFFDELFLIVGKIFSSTFVQS